MIILQKMIKYLNHYSIKIKVSHDHQPRTCLKNSNFITFFANKYPKYKPIGPAPIIEKSKCFHLIKLNILFKTLIIIL